MAGGFSVGGLISGLDSNNIIRQLIQLERQPIVRLEQRISSFQQQRTALSDFRTQLLSFRNLVRDFQLNAPFNTFQATSSADNVATATASGGNPALGSVEVEVLQLASATVATSGSRLGAAINPGAALNASGISTQVTGNTFTINGETFNIDPDVNSLNDYLFSINQSAAGVTATYDAATDTVTFENTTPGDTSIINFGAAGDTSNFLGAINVQTATQTTGGGGSTVVTSSRGLGAVKAGDTLNDINFANGPVTGGSFRINGVTITVDPATDSLGSVLQRITNSGAGVTATLDTATDTIRIVSNTLGSRTVSFTPGTSNFLDAVNFTTATQTAGTDAEFRINGGAVQTRNSNEINDIIGDVTLRFTGIGSATITTEVDSDGIIQTVRDFIQAYNEGLTKLNELTGAQGLLPNDATLRSINSILRNTIFQRVSGLSGPFNNLLDIGISTGQGFSASAVPQLSLDEDAFRSALNTDRDGVAALFTNGGNNGIGDQLFAFLDETTGQDGILNFRAKANGSIDQQIRAFNDQISRLEERVANRERRLRAQFAQLEQLSAGFQSQGQFLSALNTNFQQF